MRLNLSLVGKADPDSGSLRIIRSVYGLRVPRVTCVQKLQRGWRGGALISAQGRASRVFKDEQVLTQQSKVRRAFRRRYSLSRAT